MTNLIDEMPSTVEAEPSLFEDVVKTLQKQSRHGGWVEAMYIGLECGFDRPLAARSVQRHLKNLVKMELAEEERSGKPIIYRWKDWVKLQ